MSPRKKKAKYRPAVGNRSRGLSLAAKGIAGDIFDLGQVTWSKLDGRRLRPLIRLKLVAIVHYAKKPSVVKLTAAGTKAVKTGEARRSYQPLL